MSSWLPSSFSSLLSPQESPPNRQQQQPRPSPFQQTPRQQQTPPRPQSFQQPREPSFQQQTTQGRPFINTQESTHHQQRQSYSPESPQQSPPRPNPSGQQHPPFQPFPSHQYQPHQVNPSPLPITEDMARTNKKKKGAQGGDGTPTPSTPVDKTFGTPPGTGTPQATNSPTQSRLGGTSIKSPVTSGAAETLPASPGIPERDGWSNLDEAFEPNAQADGTVDPKSPAAKGKGREEEGTKTGDENVTKGTPEVATSVKAAADQEENTQTKSDPPPPTSTDPPAVPPTITATAPTPPDSSPHPPANVIPTNTPSPTASSNPAKIVDNDAAKTKESDSAKTKGDGLTKARGDDPLKAKVGGISKVKEDGPDKPKEDGSAKAKEDDVTKAKENGSTKPKESDSTKPKENGSAHPKENGPTNLGENGSIARTQTGSSSSATLVNGSKNKASATRTSPTKEKKHPTPLSPSKTHPAQIATSSVTVPDTPNIIPPTGRGSGFFQTDPKHPQFRPPPSRFDPSLLQRPPSPTLTAISGVTHWTALPPQPSGEEILDALDSMKETSNIIKNAFEKLKNTTSKVSRINMDFDPKREIDSLKRHMDKQDSRQEEKMSEIKGLLKTVLQDQVLPHVQNQIMHSIDERIDRQVEEQVRIQLANHLPQGLQDQVEEYRKQLDEVAVSLQNAESRRHNAMLRSHHLEDPLHELRKPDGTVSKHFPRTLSALFELEGPAARFLVLEYGLPNVGDSRERNLNRFMQFCGVAYQMTAPGVLELTQVGSPMPYATKLDYRVLQVPAAWESTDAGVENWQESTGLVAVSQSLEVDPIPRRLYALPGQYPFTEGEYHFDEDAESDGNGAVGSPGPLKTDAFGMQFMSVMMAATWQLSLLYLTQP